MALINRDDSNLGGDYQPPDAPPDMGGSYGTNDPPFQQPQPPSPQPTPPYDGGGYGSNPNERMPDPFEQGLHALYQQHYQRNATPDEINAHRGNPGGLEAIAKLFPSAAPPPAPSQAPSAPTGGGDPMAFIRQWQQGHSPSEGIGPLWQALQGGGYGNVSRYMYGATPSNNEFSINGQKTKVLSEGSGQWYTGGDDSGGGSGGGGAPSYAQNYGPPSSYGGTGVFTDPATSQFEALLNQRIQQLQTPYTAPDMGPALDYLRQYFQKLQGPAYTPQQMDLMQTQTTDPLMRDRDAARQQIIERFAHHGMGPGDGPVQDAIAQSDRAYEQMNTRGRANVANNAIGLEKQQQGQAASLGPMIAQLEQQQFAQQDNRNAQAVNLAKIIPDTAWSRLIGANGTIQNTNPLSALQLMNTFQGQGYQQGADFSQGLMGILPYLLQLFGGK